MSVFSNGTRIFNVQKVDRGELMECNKNKKDNEKNAKHLQQEKKTLIYKISVSIFFFHIYISIFSR